MAEKITCIVLEDDPLFRKTLEIYLSEMDFVDLVGAFQDPIEGAMTIAKMKPDLLLLDIEMPYLDGFETLDTLDVRPRIIVISSHLEDTQLPNMDIDKFLSKGSLRSAEQLEVAIKEVMRLN